MSAERRLFAYHEQSSARRRMSQVRGVHGEENQRRPISGAVRARGTGVFVQSQRKPG